MSRKRKLAIAIVAPALFVLLALWYPYQCGRVPEWKLQVVDQNGRPAVGAQVNQEWIDPIDDGIVSGDSRTTDSNGFVFFPKRVLHNRFALGIAHSFPSSRLLVCWQDQFGDFYWDGQPSHLAAKLFLKKGICPYS